MAGNLAAIDFTTVVTLDSRYARQLRHVWPTWRRFRPQILDRPLLLICDGAESQRIWERRLRFVDHPNRTIVLTDSKGDGSWRALRTATSFDAIAERVKTPWCLLLEANAVASECERWLDENWFGPTNERTPVLVSSPSDCRLSPESLAALENRSRCAEGASMPPGSDPSGLPSQRKRGGRNPTAGATFSTVEAIRRAIGQLRDSSPKLDSAPFLKYVAERNGEFVRLVDMRRRGWRQRRPARLRRTCAAALATSAVPTRSAVSAPTRVARKRRRQFHADELVRILKKAFGDREIVGCEVGVAKGETSAVLLQELPNLRLTMVDMWSAFPEDSAYARSGDGYGRYSEDVHRANRQAAERATEPMRDRRTILALSSLEAARFIETESQDFVFLDADHTFEAVKQDLKAWWPKVRPGGLFCGHDYGARDDLRRIWGVSRAVDQFGAAHGLDVEVGAATVWAIAKPSSLSGPSELLTEAAGTASADPTT